MDKRVLHLNFKTEGEKKFRLQISDPREDLAEEVVAPVMGGIVGSQVFGKDDLLKSVDSAIVVKTTEEIIL